MHCRPLRLSFLLASLGRHALWPSEVFATTGLNDADSFLSDYALRDSKDPATNAIQALGSQECRPTGPIDTTLCDYETLESVNDDLFSNLDQLVKMPFFKYFMVDLYRECPFWSENGQCDQPSCALIGVDESQVPPQWRVAALSQVETVKVEDTHRLTGCYYRDSDFCLLDDNTEGEYYDLSQVPERYTGYSGQEAHRVWAAIYDENCFGLSESTYAQLTRRPPAPFAQQPMMPIEPLEPAEDEMCLEKRVYYKLISGLHASISTHICADHLNQSTGKWEPNLECFLSKLSPSEYPERIPNIYFNTVLLLRAVSRISPFLKTYDYCSSGTHEEDDETLNILGNVAEVARQAGRFDEGGLFKGMDSVLLKDEFKAHFRNVSQIMDCVGCAKCSLWGKVQTTGIATALKILFEMDEGALDPTRNHELLQRSELVALFNTLHRFSESLHAINLFRDMMLQAADAPPTSADSQSFAGSLVSLCRASIKAWLQALVDFFGKLTDAMHPRDPRFGPGGPEL